MGADAVSFFARRPLSSRITLSSQPHPFIFLLVAAPFLGSLTNSNGLSQLLSLHDNIPRRGDVYICRVRPPQGIRLLSVLSKLNHISCSTSGFLA